MKRFFLLLLAAGLSFILMAATPRPAPNTPRAGGIVNPTPTPPARAGAVAPAPARAGVATPAPARGANPNQPTTPVKAATKPATKPAILAMTKPAAPTSLPTAGNPLTDSEYRVIFGAELGRLWRSENFEVTKSAQKLLEQYFSTPAKRKEAVDGLEKLNVDPNYVGRLTRIRANWPELKPGVYFTIEKMNGNPVQYFIGIPKGYTRTKAVPLVIWLCDFLPFIDENGNPLDLRFDQVAELYARWIEAEMKEHPDAAVLMPMININDKWGPGYRGLNRAYLPVQHVQDRVNVDPSQIYLVGHSLPAESIWDLALHHPTYYTSLMPLAGEVVSHHQTMRMPNLRNIPVFLWHDVDDELVSVKLAQAISKDLKEKGGKIEYKETKKIGHFPTPEICNELYRKMRAVKRPLYPQLVSLASNRPQIPFNRNDWIQVFQYLTPGKDEYVITGKTSILTVDNGCSIDGKIDLSKNTITVTGKNVQSFRIYVNDQMVDLNKNVIVTYNGAKRHDAIIKPSMTKMLEDQLLLGRGWRYYSNYIEVDFAAIAEANMVASTRPATRPVAQPTTPRSGSSTPTPTTPRRAP